MRKTKMKHIIKMLNNDISKACIDIPTYRDIPITDFEYEDVVKICVLFANEQQNVKGLNYE